MLLVEVQYAMVGYGNLLRVVTSIWQTTLFKWFMLMLEMQL